MPTNVDPGKTPGSAEGGALDQGPNADRAGKTPGSAESGPLDGGPMGRTKMNEQSQLGPKPPGHEIDRKAGDPPA
jgi:hypothetical protein